MFMSRESRLHQQKNLTSLAKKRHHQIKQQRILLIFMYFVLSSYIAVESSMHKSYEGDITSGWQHQLQPINEYM